MFKTKFFQISCSLLLFLTLPSCTSLQNEPTLESKGQNFDSIKIGDSYSKLTSIYGPGVEETEPFTGKKMLVLSYAGNALSSREDFYLDSLKRNIVIKMQWIDEKSQFSNKEFMLKTKFPNASFKNYFPCHSFGDEKILIDQKQNVQIFTHNDFVHLLVITNQEFMDEYISNLYAKCPSIQPKKDN